MSGRENRAGGVRETGVCGCLVECSLKEFPKWLNHPEADMVEWRMDEFARNHSMEEMESFAGILSAGPRLPVIATNRPIREMGAFSGSEELRLSMLEKAARCGADWIDIEHDTDADHIARLRQAGSKVLLSWHSPAGTPSGEELRGKLESMRKTGADALKMVTMAQSGEDSLRVLELIPLAKKELGIDLVAFCMGPVGSWSRLVSLFLGSPWTYAHLEGQSVTAPGQLSASDLRRFVRSFGQGRQGG